MSQYTEWFAGCHTENGEMGRIGSTGQQSPFSAHFSISCVTTYPATLYVFKWRSDGGGRTTSGGTFPKLCHPFLPPSLHSSLVLLLRVPGAFHIRNVCILYPNCFSPLLSIWLQNICSEYHKRSALRSLQHFLPSVAVIYEARPCPGPPRVEQTLCFMDILESHRARARVREWEGQNVPE